MSTPLVIFFSALLGLVALGLPLLRNLVAVMVMLSVYSALLAVNFALLGAADVAFTEAVVGTGVSTLFFMGLLTWVDPDAVTYRGGSQRLLGLAGALLVCALFLYGFSAIPPFGSAGAPPHEHPLVQAYVHEAGKKLHTPNIVTAVLADYRSFDSLIEATVVLTAALACGLALRRRDASAL
jgi:multicomponent Na+:H+ antiporter subunit B